MTYLCKCGAFKTAQPYKSSITKDWICERCANRPTRQKPSMVMQRTRTLDILKKKVIR